MSNAVRIERFFPLDSKELFSYFVEKDLIERWFAPAEMTLIMREFHPLSGGRYSYYLRGKQGLWPCEGTFREVKPYDTIIMFDAFLIDPEGNVQLSNIDTHFKFIEGTDGTTLSMTQTGFFNSEAESAAEISWNQRLSYLSGLIDDEVKGNLEEPQPRTGHKTETHIN
ncbi:MAG TPA: SRPBCC domain-containing protein [Bacteriovoracaceae bacterium]|nr:SRPBCC domain-containing protein [Bacteriovoracaceae bacterium]